MLDKVRAMRDLSGWSKLRDMIDCSVNVAYTYT